MSTVPKLTLADFAKRTHLLESWQSLAKRDTAPGPDGVSIRTFGQSLNCELDLLQQTLARGQYQPRVAKRIWLAKDAGGERGIIILCVRDRVAQGAVRRALGTVFTSHLQACSYAYRHGLGALSAIRKLIEYRDSGRTWVVRGDIAKFFDSVPHQPLLQHLGTDLHPAALEQLRTILRLPTSEGDVQSITERGLVQGSPLSPLLSNIYLTPFDQAVTKPGHGPIRFADDFVIACASPTQAGQALEQAERSLAQLQLSLNDEKTRIVSFKQGFSFLGFSFSGHRVRIDKPCLSEFKSHVRHLLNRPGEVNLREVNNLIRGWRAYYQLGDVHEDFRGLEEWLQDSFSAHAKQLDSLIPDATPQRKAPTLGGYRVRRATSKQPELTAIALKPAPWKVTCDLEGKPLEMTRGAKTYPVKDLSPLRLPETLLQALLTALQRAQLHHRLNAARRWPNGAGNEVLRICAQAKGKVGIEQVNSAYDQRLLAFAPSGTDMCWARGRLRHFLRNLVWHDLLAQGLCLGPENGDIPRLVCAFASAFEAPLVDYTLLRSLKYNSLAKSVPEFQRNLTFKIFYHDTRCSWREVLAEEAVRLTQALREKQPFKPWLWEKT